MHVGHGGDVVVDDSQAGDVLQLALRIRVGVVGPDLDRDALRSECFLDRHSGSNRLSHSCRETGGRLTFPQSDST